MTIIEILSYIALLLLGIEASITDIRNGHIYNKILLCFAVCGVVLNIIYYGYFARDLFVLFVGNYLLIAAISLWLFYSHSFAGGDCKLILVMGILYPANYYVIYGTNEITIFFAIGFAILYGYIYLLIASLFSLIRDKKKIPMNDINGYFLSFGKSFVTASVYISLFSLFSIYLQELGYASYPWVFRLASMGITLLVGKCRYLKKWFVVLGVFFIDLTVSFCLDQIPFSVSPENYILVVILLLCQLTIKSNLYEEVELKDLKKGMILSTYSSMMMQNSRVRGLPKLSTEDLQSRLKDEEIDSIKRWAKSRKVGSLTVVKKIPFAVFIFLGFITYFIIWSFVR